MNDANLLEDQPIAWTPTPDVIEQAQLTKFMRQVGVSTWDELYDFSIRDVERFTEEVLKFLDIKFDPPYEKLLDTSGGVEFPKWFGRNADALVRNEGEARTTAATFANKKGWHERGYLPHFDGVATQFITFRLADSLPQSVLRRLKEELEKENLSDNSDEYRQRVEDYLDKGIGSCILKNTAIAEIVEATLKHEHDRSCRLICWVIMPNHVHILLYPLQGNSLSNIVKSIKSVSSHRINKLLGHSGSVWQPDYFDRFIRDEDHFTKTVSYVANNPVKAGLCSAPEDWRFSSFSPQAAISGTRTPSSAMSAKHEQISPGEPTIADEGVRVPSAGLNITEMCLDRWQTEEMKDQPAVIWEGEEEDFPYSTISYEKLWHEVDCVSNGLRRDGFSKGDAIGIHLPMLVETIVSLLAISRIGAIAVPVFSGYGVDAIASRMNAVNARALITCDKFPRRGKTFDALEVANAAMAVCPTIRKAYVVHRHAIDDIDFSRIDDRFDDYYALGSNPIPRAIEPTSAEDSLIILYTSGTTGKPKGIAHTHASFPIKAAQDMAFGTDVGKGTRISWYTDIGWMMGPWLIYGALINGATICIYDGAPDYPTPDRMWEFCAKHKVEVLGISPTLVRSLASHEGRSEGRSEDTPVLMDAASASRSTSGAGTADEDKIVPPPTERRGWSRHGKLPHFDGEVAQFITFRLADSLPRSVLNRLRDQLEHDKLDDDSEELRQLVEDYLDSGAGECILRETKIAEIVRETILYEHGKSCDLKAWVIMPNHVHLLLRLSEGHDLAGLMKRIKGISARRINQLQNTTGPIWQADYFDRYIRDGEHFSKVFAYIENNPVLAKLSKTAEEYRFSSAHRSEDTPVLMDDASTSRRTLGGGTADEDKIVLTPFERHDLSSLRIFASTGEPWNPAPWWWLFEKVGNSKLPIINYSGGTEIAGGILMGNPLLPIKPCSFPAPCPGMDVDILDEEGKPVDAGKVGELVIRQPWIGMARGFWQEKERYLETYWRRFKDIWVHGDWAMRDKDGHWFILGRSDDTLKVAGKRVGPAEVESLLVAHPLVTEAAVIGVPDEVKGTAMVAFVVRSADRSEDTPVLMDAASASRRTFGGGTADADKSVRAPLEAELKALVARDMGKPLAPSKIHFVSALPKTRNAKVMRRVIRAAYLGEDPGDLSALENPQAIDEIAKAGEITNATIS